MTSEARNTAVNFLACTPLSTNGGNRWTRRPSRRNGGLHSAPHGQAKASGSSFRSWALVACGAKYTDCNSGMPTNVRVPINLRWLFERSRSFRERRAANVRFVTTEISLPCKYLQTQRKRKNNETWALVILTPL